MTRGEIKEGRGEKRLEIRGKKDTAENKGAEGMEPGMYPHHFRVHARDHGDRRREEKSVCEGGEGGGGGGK